jgi:subtilisin
MGEGGMGEGGMGEGGMGEGGSDEERSGVMYPGRYSEVITVGALTQYELEAPFSNRGPELNALAPGVDIVSTKAGGGLGFASGTSMATAHVSGVIALMLSRAWELDKELTPSDVQGILKESTSDDGTVDLNAALLGVKYFKPELLH